MVKLYHIHKYGNFSLSLSPFCQLLPLLNNTCACTFPGQEDVSCGTTVRCLREQAASRGAPPGSAEKIGDGQGVQRVWGDQACSGQVSFCAPHFCSFCLFFSLSQLLLSDLWILKGLLAMTWRVNCDHLKVCWWIQTRWCLMHVMTCEYWQGDLCIHKGWPFNT